MKARDALRLDNVAGELADLNARLLRIVRNLEQADGAKLAERDA